MLTAYQIDALRDKATTLLDPVINFLIEDIAERVSEAGQLTGTAAYQVWRAQRLGMSQKKLKKEIAKRLKIPLAQVEQLMRQAAKTGYNFDLSRLPHKRGVPFEANSGVQQIVDAAVSLAQQNLTNIVQTMGFVNGAGQAQPLTSAYQQACDQAFMKSVTGATDYISAVRNATRGLAAQGIVSIDYASGVHTSIEAAVRRNIMGGLGLMQEQISEHNHDALGCNGWEISAHRGSAPDHEPFQGRQYDDKTYKNLNNSLLRRIGTLNCGHSASPIILGVNEPQYTPQELEQMRQENAAGVTFDGKHYTLYEATQRQRKIERRIRDQKRKILIDEKLGDQSKLETDQIRLVRLRQEYSRFSKGVGLRTQHERAEVAGFTWKHGKAAEGQYQKRVDEVGEAAALQNWHTIPVAGGHTNTKYRKITTSGQGSSPTTDSANQVIDENVRRTNPAYKTGGAAYRQNCQRCVAAYEMRRRGYDVIAKPAVVGTDGKLSSQDPLFRSWKSVFKGAKFEIHSGFDGGKASIISQMDSWGDGAVAEVRVLWNTSDAREAHVFVAQRVNGVVRFIDPQNGNLNCEEYFTNAILGATMIARIDNLEPTELIEQCIKNRGGKSDYFRAGKGNVRGND